MTKLQTKWYGSVQVSIYLINTKPTKYLASAIYDNDYRLIARTEQEYFSMTDAQDAMSKLAKEHRASWDEPGAGFEIF